MRFKNLVPVLLLQAALLLLLAACADTGSANSHKLSELVPGVTTQADAIAKLGQPAASRKIGSRTALQWTDTSSSKPASIVVLFGMDGRMIEAATDADGHNQKAADVK